MNFINIGFGNYISEPRIITVVTPDSAPIKRILQEAKSKGNLIDASCGRRTKSVIITDSDHVILSCQTAEKILSISTTHE